MNYSPQRTCVVCRKKSNKQNFFRVAEQQDKFILDVSHKINARGFYICKNKNCVSNIVSKRVLSRVKKTNIAQSEHLNLQECLNKNLNEE